MRKLLKNKNCKENPRRIVTKIEEFQKCFEILKQIFLTKNENC